MISYEKRILLRIIEQLDGLSKYEAYDILQQTEMLINNFKNPIQSNEIKNFFLKEENIISKMIYNKGPYELEDQCHYLSIYRLKTENGHTTDPDMYFRLSKDGEFHLYNAEILQAAFNHTHLKYSISHFIKDNNILKRNSKTDRLLLLELLDQIDPL